MVYKQPSAAVRKRSAGFLLPQFVYDWRDLTSQIPLTSYAGEGPVAKAIRTVGSQLLCCRLQRG